MAYDTFPPPTAGKEDDRNFNYPSGPLGPKMMDGIGIGGTHHVSTRITPEQALTGGYTPIEGDSTPNPLSGGEPYLPKN
jgi:hypothetical protein